MKRLIVVTDFTKNKIGNDSSILISEDRIRRAQMLKSEEEVHKFISAERITMAAIAKFFALEHPQIVGAVGEKPILQNRKDLSFSRSYASNLLALAMEEKGTIGVDAEEIKKADAMVMKYFFTEKEKEYVEHAVDPDFAFSLIWTRKESFIKCTGKGLQYGFHLLDTTPTQEKGGGQKMFANNDCVNGYAINSYQIGNTVLSVCSERDDEFPLFLQMR